MINERGREGNCRAAVEIERERERGREERERERERGVWRRRLR